VAGALPTIAPPDADTCIVQLGRTGDVLNIMPIAAATGCGLMVHEQYAAMVRGCSQIRVETWGGRLEDWQGAAKLADEKYGRVIVTQLFPGRACFEHYTDCWAADEWARCGVPYGGLPLTFDRRDAARERALVKRHDDGRPMLLLNVRGISGRYPEADSLAAEVRQRFGQRFNVVETPQVEPFYDLLGLYDHAALLVTIDTATLHLCWASPVRSVQLMNDLVDPWLASRPKGNCVASLMCSEALRMTPDERCDLIAGAVVAPDL
jgi:hypothetical protein